jgi:hypothetical protein
VNVTMTGGKRKVGFAVAIFMISWIFYDSCSAENQICLLLCRSKDLECPGLRA